MIDARSQFRDAIQAAGICPPETVEPDGKLHRFPSDGRNSDDAGWYIFHDDGIPAGAFGDWRTGLSQKWRADTGRELSPAEEAECRAKVEAIQRERDAAKTREQFDAASKAAMIWEAARPAPEDHPYLNRKGITPKGARLHNDALVIPMRAGGELHSVQFISPDGDKRFLPGGRVTGCYCSIGNLDGAAALCIAEGFATGATIHEATGYPVAVAFAAGNLVAVAKAMRERFVELPLILCADDDAATEGNPGITKATEAARLVGGRVAVPDFGIDQPYGATDFNDLATVHGLGVVNQGVAAALAHLIGERQPSAGNTPKGDVKIKTNTDDAIIKRLAMLSPLEYDRVRKEEADALGVRLDTLDKQVLAARNCDTEEGMDFVNVEPWHEPIDPSALLTEISTTVQRFIICQKETADAVALWVAMTWIMDAVQIAPLAVITAPEKRCGKSLLLVLIARLAHRPLTASSISPAAMFRAVEAWRPTLLIDEADSFMRDNEELRGIVNAGHTRESAYVVRVAGEKFTPTKFSVWGAKALAGIGQQADTIMDRAVVLELRRKLPHEKVARLRHAESGLFERLSQKLARFADDYRKAIRIARPELPASLGDRAQDNWEPLLAIADVAGGEWPKLGRHAALKLSGSDSPTMSTGTELLADIKEIFERTKADRISTADLITALCFDDERPWATYNRGKPISPRQVSKRLNEYGIGSGTIRIGPNTPKGFMRESFGEAFSRYLATPSATSATPPQTMNDAALSVADGPPRFGNELYSATQKPAPTLGCGGVADNEGDTLDTEMIEVEV